jgi:hypothetical protein
MARYALAEHVFVCLNGDHLVLLDLKKDRYWALEAAKTAGLGQLVGGWPVQSPAVSLAASSPTQSSAPLSAPSTQVTDGAADMSSDTTATIDILRSRGLLTERVRSGKDATPVAAMRPQRELICESERTAVRANGDWLNFFAASATAKIALRTWPFERVIRRVRRRKERLERAGGADTSRARELVEAFANYRVFLFSSKNECLYDSLALLEYLARHAIHADWVFGVQTRPFAAHCWVQHDDIVFNDTVEHVSGYTPIMVV